MRLRERDGGQGLWPVKQVRARAAPRAVARPPRSSPDREARRDGRGTGHALGWNAARRRAGATSPRASSRRTSATPRPIDVLRLQEEAEAYALYQARAARARRARLRRAACSAPSSCSASDRTSCAATSASSATCSWTSSRTPTWPRSCCSSSSAAARTSRTTSSSWATTTSPSTASAAPAMPPSAASRSASREPPTWDPGPSGAGRSQPVRCSRTAVRPAISWPPPTGSSRATRSASQGRPAAPADPATLGEPVELVVRHGRAGRGGRRSSSGSATTFEVAAAQPRRWSDIAVLYRTHRHREPSSSGCASRTSRTSSSVAPGCSTCQPEVRDLEAALCGCSQDPTDSVELRRGCSTSGPVAASMPPRSIARLRARPEADFDASARASRQDDLARRPRRSDRRHAIPARRAHEARHAPRVKLSGCRLLDELVPRGQRDGPFACSRSTSCAPNLLHDLIAIETPDAQRTVLALARFMRFVADWQRVRPARQPRSTSSPTSTSTSRSAATWTLERPVGSRSSGVQLMTVYQAKGLEYEAVVVPRVVGGPVPRHARGAAAPARSSCSSRRRRQEFADEEERRLLFVAMTRARDRLLVTTIAQPGSAPPPEPLRGRGRAAARRRTRATGRRRTRHRPMSSCSDGPSGPSPRSRPSLGPRMAALRLRTMTAGRSRGGRPSATLRVPDAGTAALERLMPVPTAFERRYAPAATGRRAHRHARAARPRRRGRPSWRSSRELVTVATDAAGAAEEERRRGIDPLTMRVIARHAPAGQALLAIAPLPSAFSHTQFRTYGECGLRYAFERIYRIPTAETKGFFEFGTLVHATFEDFVKRRREARAAGEPGPTFEDLRGCLRRALDARDLRRCAGGPALPAPLRPSARALLRARARVALGGDRHRAGLHPRARPTRRWCADQGPGRPRPHRPPPRRLHRGPRLQDRHRPSRRAGSTRTSSSPPTPSRWPGGAVIEEATGEPIAAASKLTLYFTESDQAISTTRTPEQLAEHEAHLVETAMRIRSGDFTATPDYRRCGWCDFRRICPSRYRTPEG